MELKDLDEKNLPGRVKPPAMKAWDDLVVEILMEACEKKPGKKMTQERVHEVPDALVDRGGDGQPVNRVFGRIRPLAGPAGEGPCRRIRQRSTP